MAYTGSKSQVGRGTIVSIGGQTGTGGTFTTIGEVTDASFSGAAWGTVDVTNFDSGVDDEFISTTRNNGDLTLQGNMIDAEPGQVALFAAYDTGFKYDFKVQLQPAQGQTTGKVYTFSALVTSLETSIQTRSVVNFNTKLKISGAITRTAGS